MTFKRPLRREGTQWQNLPNEMKALIQQIMAVDGVAEVYLTPYRIEIRKGSLFSWPSITPVIAQALNSFDESLGGTADQCIFGHRLNEFLATELERIDSEKYDTFMFQIVSGDYETTSSTVRNRLGRKVPTGFTAATGPDFFHGWLISWSRRKPLVILRKTNGTYVRVNKLQAFIVG
jgi:hypothetical protein